MKSPARRTAANYIALLLLSTTFLISTGCLRATNETRDKHIFVGEEPIRGAVQVNTNKKVPVVSIDDKGNAHYEERDCGQFVILPPHTYREMRKLVNEYNRLRMHRPEVIEGLIKGMPEE